MKKITLVPLVLLSGAFALAQETMEAPGEMDQLKFIVGEWEGEGWVMTGPGQRETFRVEELAEMKLGGSVLYLEGRGVAIAKGQPMEKVLHQAMVLIHFDQKQNQFLMRSYRAGGHVTDAEITVEDKKISWGFDVAQGQMRYRLQLNNRGQWVETGEISMDGGQNYLKFFEMTLDRVGKRD